MYGSRRTVVLDNVSFTQDSISSDYVHGAVAGWSVHYVAMLLRHGNISIEDGRYLVLHVYEGRSGRLWALNNRTLAALKLAFRGCSVGKQVPAVVHPFGGGRDQEFVEKSTTLTDGKTIDVRTKKGHRCAMPTCSASRRGVHCEFRCCATCCIGCSNHRRRAPLPVAAVPKSISTAVRVPAATPSVSREPVQRPREQAVTERPSAWEKPLYPMLTQPINVVVEQPANPERTGDRVLTQVQAPPPHVEEIRRERRSGVVTLLMTLAIFATVLVAAPAVTREESTRKN